MATNFGTIDVGNILRFAAVFTDPFNSAAPVDPDSVWFATLDPLGTTVRYEYGVDAALKRTATGTYHIDISFDTAGPWSVRWYSTGTYEGATDGFLIVSASALQ